MLSDDISGLQLLYQLNPFSIGAFGLLLGLIAALISTIIPGNHYILKSSDLIGDQSYYTKSLINRFRNRCNASV